MLTHKNIVANTLQIVAFLTVAEPGKEKIMAALPFSDVYGLTSAMNVAVYLASQMLITPALNATDHLLRMITNEQATILAGTPSMYHDLINHRPGEPHGLRSIKVALSGPTVPPMDLQTRFSALTQRPLTVGYGAPGVAPVTHCHPIGGEHRIGSIGLPLPNVDAKLVSPDTGMPVRWGSGEAGELHVRGPNVMHGYWNQPDEAARIIDEDGWLRTGDVARMDEDGYFYIVGKAGDTLDMDE